MTRIGVPKKYSLSHFFSTEDNREAEGKQSHFPGLLRFCILGVPSRRLQAGEERTSEPGGDLTLYWSSCLQGYVSREWIPFQDWGME